ncbi:MAG: hypothetical protein U5K99_07200 [Anaerolineales bacterium]|nr:hypothetical protein [Anaerolineales bacterium]
MADLIIHYPRGHERHAFQGHPERPERVEAVVEGMQKTGCWDRAELLEPLELDTSLLETVHNPAYLEVLQRASAGGRFLDGDTYTTTDSWDLAKQAAGGQRQWPPRSGKGGERWGLPSAALRGITPPWTEGWDSAC